MAGVLRRLVAQGPVPAHAGRSLEASASPAASTAVAAHSPPHPELTAETLTWREAEVLKSPENPPFGGM
jgi:hypothetical protein